MPMETTRRGAEHTFEMGPLQLLFRSGVDTPASVPAYNLTAGELFARNRSNAPVELRFDSADTHVHAFRFTFGADGQASFSYPRPLHGSSSTRVALAPRRATAAGANGLYVVARRLGG